MKLMVTGAGGLLGSRIAAYYKDTYKVWAVGHGELELTDESAVQNAVRDFGPDVVIHCAAISDVGACTADPDRSYAVNVQGTQYLARACAHVSAKMIYCSSDQVYFQDPAAGEDSACFLQPHSEEEKLLPVPVYGRHKLLAEQLCLEEQPDSVILRLTWMYDSLTERELSQGRGNLITMAEEALRSSRPLAFSRKDHRGVTDMRRVVSQMEKVWRLPAGIYNYGSSNDTNMYDTMKEVFGRLGRPELVVQAPEGRLRNLTMDTKKAEESGICFPASADGVAEFLTKSVVR